MKFPNFHIVWTEGKSLSLPDLLAAHSFFGKNITDNCVKIKILPFIDHLGRFCRPGKSKAGSKDVEINLINGRYTNNVALKCSYIEVFMS